MAYTLHVSPQHAIEPDGRIVIEMPELLEFDQSQGCQTIVTVCECVLNGNQITLSQISAQEIKGGSLLKFTILSGDNPVGARQVGPWSI